MLREGSFLERVVNNLADSFTRLRELVFHPMQEFQSGSIRQLDAAVVILVLMLLTALQKVLWAVQTGIPTSTGAVIQQVLLAVLLGWGGLSSLFYFIAKLAKKEPDFTRITVLVAAAGLPLVVTTFLSVLVIAICLVLGIRGSGEPWQQVQQVLGWAGLVLGWPGWFSAMALNTGGKIQWRIAMIISGALLAFLIAGSILPVFLQ